MITTKPVLRKVADCSLLSVSHSNHLARLGPFEIYHLTPSPPILVRQKVDRSSSHLYHIVLSGPAFKSKIDESFAFDKLHPFPESMYSYVSQSDFSRFCTHHLEGTFQADFLILKKLWAFHSAFNFLVDGGVTFK